MFDIITFGSAAWDIFLRPDNFETLKSRRFITGRGICFNLGSKVDLGEIYFSSGGGGTNAAATFSKQGFKVAYYGRIGDDLAGREIIKELKKFRINRTFVSKTKSKPTNHSIILNASAKRERTILVYLGASELLGKKDILWNKLKPCLPPACRTDRAGRAKWFYLAPLSGKLCNLFEPLVNFGYKNKIKIAANPGNTQLSLPQKSLKRILKKVNILILNQEEASLLTKIPYQKEEEIFKKIDEICPGITIMTKGSEGAVVSDGRELYRAGAPKVKLVDKTGAGDAAASGFISGIIKSGGDIEYAIQLGMANATSCLKKWGAKNGLLRKNQKFKKVKVIKKSL